MAIPEVGTRLSESLRPYFITIMKKILTLIFLSVFCLNAINAEVTWKLENGTLTISGTGNMENYSYRTAPWSNQRYVIHHVIIEQGITSIGDYSFQDCVDLFSVIIPNSVITIGNGAFYGRI